MTILNLRVRRYTRAWSFSNWEYTPSGQKILPVEKYQESESVPTEQLVLDMRELFSTAGVALDTIITLFIRLGRRAEAETSSKA